MKCRWGFCVLATLIELVVPSFRKPAHAAVLRADMPAMKTALKRPEPRERPTVVRIAAYLVDITNFNEQDQTVGMDLIVTWGWRDSKLADSAAKERRIVPLSEIWNPQLIAVNRRSGELLFPPAADVDASGTVTAIQRMTGTVSIPVDLRNFPFDKQNFFIEFVSRGYGPNEITFEVDPKRTGREREMKLPGWEIGRLAINPFVKKMENNDGKHSIVMAGFKIQIEAARNAQYYILREILPLVFIVLMASALFWIPVTEHGMKVGISTAAIFSLMAYYVQLGRSMPRLDYLTRMDRFVIGATFLVFISFAQVIAGMFLVKKGQVPKVERMEKWSRVIYVILLASIIWGAFV